MYFKTWKVFEYFYSNVFILVLYNTGLFTMDGFPFFLDNRYVKVPGVVVYSRTPSDSFSMHS